MATLIILALLTCQVSAYLAPARWGQAAAVLNNNTFLVFGGRQDRFNMYSYTSAPPTDDLLYLSLSTSFNPASPPWQPILGSDLSLSQGPAVSWSTLSAYNATHLLLFGGSLGPNSPEALPAVADSAVLLNVASTSSPSFNPIESVNQPQSRIYHTSSSTPRGVYIIGGVRPDGSNLGFSTHYVFDPSGPSFTPLPTTGGPGDIAGHAAVVTRNGQLLVLGGISTSTSTLMPLTTIFSLDTTRSPPTWTSWQTDTSDAPRGRRGFAAVLVQDNQLLIHGGADATLETTYSDAYMLDLNTRTWSGLSEVQQALGPRRDHFAVAVDYIVLFGFGYGQNGPAPSELMIYETSSQSFVPMYLPPRSLRTAPTPTPPATSQTSTTASSTSQVSPTGNGTSIPASSSTSPSTTASGGRQNLTGIIVGSIFAILAVLTGVVIAGYYIRRNNRLANDPRGFERLNETNFTSADEGSVNREIPTAGPAVVSTGRVRRSATTRVLNAIGIGSDGIPRSATKRKDILADEDTREFSTYGAAHKREGTAGSNWSVFTLFGAGAGAGPSRLPSPWVDEKGGGEAQDALLAGQADVDFDPYAHEQRKDSVPASLTPGNRPAPRFEYVDPFEDDGSSVIDLTEYWEPADPDVAAEPRGLQEPPGISPFFEPAAISSRTSHEAAVPARSSIIDRTPSEPIRRSQSWWTRLSRSSFLDRRLSEGGQRTRINFRDPVSPPPLYSIRESFHSGASSTTSQPVVQEGQTTLTHERSVASVRTAQTADSGVIERMGAIDVIQRMGTDTSQFTSTSPETSPLSAFPVNASDVRLLAPVDPLEEVEIIVTESPTDIREGEAETGSHTSTTAGTTAGTTAPESEKSQELDPTTIPLPLSPVSAFSQLSDEHSTHSRSRHSVKYGLVTRAELFIVNPDRENRQPSDP